MIFNCLNFFFLFCFALSAIVQYNDPDALIWIAMYLSGAGMCVIQALGRQQRWLPPLLLTISLSWIAWLLPSIVGQVPFAEIIESISMKTRAVEEAREIGGLLIVAIWAAAITIKQRSI